MSDPDLPVTPGPDVDTPNAPQEGIALCLSGGGYRAMVFHVGALLRLNDAALLSRIKRVSSVSGGSITAAVLGLHWKKLQFDNQGIARRLDIVRDEVRKLARQTIDEGSILGGIFSSDTIGERVAEAYKEHLFGNATLQDLPSDAEGPRFVINATNCQTGALFRFSKPFLADYQLGLVRNPAVPLAAAVAASSAFPPFLSPVELDLRNAQWQPGDNAGIQNNDFRKVVLTDGGVYDNLGLETAWKNYKTVLVSDGGGKMSCEKDIPGDWARHSKRILDVIDNQVRSLRKRHLIDSYKANPAHPNHRSGAFWGIRTNIADYNLANALAAPHHLTMALASTPTRLKEMDDRLQERLINWGYAVCDAALRAHFNPNNALPPGHFPYPNGVN